MWTWIIIIPIIILANSFAIGKVYKRFNVYLSSYASISYGMITFFGLFGFILVPLLLFTIEFGPILIIYLIAQLVLALIYIFNWRWIFISYRIDFKNIFLWITVMAVCFIGYLITRSYANVEVDQIKWYLEGDYYEYLTKFIAQDADKIQVFKFGDNYFDKPFIYLFYAIFANLFNIVATDFKLYFTYISLFILMMLMSTAMMSIFVKKGTHFSIGKILVLMITALLISVISFVFPDFMWIIIFTILLVDTHSLRENQFSSSAAIYMINFIVFAGVVFNIHFLIVAIVINLTHTFLSFQARKEKCIDYNVLTLFATFLMLGMSFSNTFYVGFIFIILVIGIYTFYLFYKSSNIAVKVNKAIDNFLYEYINFIIVAIVVILTIVSITYFLTVGNFTIAPDLWTFKTIGTPPQLVVGGSFRATYINVVFAIVNVIVFLAALINSGMINLNKYGKVFRLKNEKRILSSQFNLTIFVILVFWNPISTNLYDQLLNTVNILGFIPNFQVIFAAMIVPCFLAMSKHFFNYQKLTVTTAGYSGIILAITSLLVLGINLV